MKILAVKTLHESKVYLFNGCASVFISNIEYEKCSKMFTSFNVLLTNITYEYTCSACLMRALVKKTNALVRIGAGAVYIYKGARSFPRRSFPR